MDFSERSSHIKSRSVAKVERISQAKPRPSSYDPTLSLVSKQFSLVARFHSASVAARNLVMLVRKKVMEGLDELEEFILYDSYLLVSSMKDRSFWSRRFSQRFTQLTAIMRIIQEVGPEKTREFYSKGFFPFQPTDHAYFGWRNTWKASFFVKRRNRQLERKAPPKKFVGVGYGDNGQCRDSSYDGSPSWQEVASSTPEGHHSPYSDKVRGPPYVFSHIEKRRILIRGLE